MLCLYLEVLMIAFSPSFIEFDVFRCKTLKKAYYGRYIFVLLAIFLIHMYMACNEVFQINYESTFNIVCGITSNTNLNNVDLIHDLGWKLDNRFRARGHIHY